MLIIMKDEGFEPWALLRSNYEFIFPIYFLVCSTRCLTATGLYSELNLHMRSMNFWLQATCIYKYHLTSIIAM